LSAGVSGGTAGRGGSDGAGRTDKAIRGPLEHLRVIDVSEHLSGQYAARLLAAMGARVTLIEPEGGSRVRRLHPRDARTGESYVFQVLSRGKHLVSALDEGEWAGQVGDADLVISGLSQVVPDHQLRDGAHISGIVSDFGASGPRAAWRGSEMIHQALGGAMYVTGEKDREPLYGCSYRSYFSTGVALLSGLLAALQVVDESGTPVPQAVEVTVAETAASMAQNGATQYNYNGSWQGRGEYPGLMERLKCADGWVVIFALRHWPEFCAAFGVPELAADPRFATPGSREGNWAEALAAFRSVAAQRRAAELVEPAQAGKACVEQMNALADALDSRHFGERELFRREGKVLGLGPAWRLSATPLWR
jgi:crotonobetainyl-CoA:carnitine CoA-transferase CaiB-like acyl-CoA transferase